MNYKWAIFNSKLLNYQRVHNVILGCWKWWVTPWKQCGGFKPWRVAPSGFLGLPGLGFESQCCSSRLDAWWRINTTYLKQSKAIYQLRTHILLWHYHPQKKHMKTSYEQCSQASVIPLIYWVYWLLKKRIHFMDCHPQEAENRNFPGAFSELFLRQLTAAHHRWMTGPGPRRRFVGEGQGASRNHKNWALDLSSPSKTWKLPNSWATFRKIVDPGSHFDMLWSIETGTSTDFKSMPKPDFFGQIGDGLQNHCWWGRSEVAINRYIYRSLRYKNPSSSYRRDRATPQMVDCLRISQVCTEKYWTNRPWQNGWIFLCQDCCTMVVNRLSPLVWNGCNIFSHRCQNHPEPLPGVNRPRPWRPVPASLLRLSWRLTRPTWLSWLSWLDAWLTSWLTRLSRTLSRTRRDWRMRKVWRIAAWQGVPWGVETWRVQDKGA